MGVRAARRTVVVGCGVLAVLGPAAGPSAAKSEISLTARAAIVPGPAGVIVVLAEGGDDAAGFQQLCVDRRIGDAGWHKLACAPVTFGAGGTVHEDVRSGGPGPESFRARLMRVRSACGGRPVVDRVSRVATVTPAAGPAERPKAGQAPAFAEA